MKFPGGKGTAKNNKGKKGKKKWIAIGICVVVVAAGAGVFIMNGLRSKSVNASNLPAMNAAAEKGTISTSIESTGSLANSEAVDVDVPIGIEIEEVKVESGDTVNAGDVLATVDAASLNAELSDTQEAIEALDTEINEESSDSTTKKVYATVDGRVKKIYASSGDAVNSVMLENGALMLISLDGKMAVTFETTQAVSAGDDVDVVLADGTVKDGTVAKVSGTACTVTCTDYGTGYQEAVTVQDSDGNTLGAGNLEIHQELKVMETTGTVSSISISENEKVYVDEKLFTLSGDFASAEYYSLVKERENLEEKLELLLSISQNNAITANTNGVITDINVSAGTVSSSSASSSSSSSSSSDSESSSGMSGMSYNSQVHTTQGTSGTTAGFVTLGSTSVQSAATEEQTEIVSGSDEADSNTENTNQRTTAAVATTSESESPETPTETPTPTPTETLADTTKITKINTINITAPVTGATPDTAIDETSGYSSAITWTPNDKVFKESTVYAAKITLTAKSGYYFGKGVAPVVKGAVVSGVEIRADGNTVEFTATFPTTEKESSQNSTGGSNEDNQTTQGGNTSSSSGLTSSSGSGTNSSSGMSSSGSSGSTGSASASASDATSAAASSDSSSSSSSDSENTELVTAFGIAENENMELSVSVDELDILSIEVGQKAAITLDALENETFEGEITSIDTNGSSSSGVTKYTTKIAVAKNESMMSGMNASVSIIVEEKSDILLIPSLAVTEQGNKSVVYTKKDDSTGELSGEIEVETGVTDGNNIEITSGLNEGDTVYYSMPVTTTDSSSSETQEFNMGGGMMQGGDMPSGGGSMPSGGSSGGRGGMGGGGQ